MLSVTVRRLEPADAEEYRAFRLQALRRWPAAFTSTWDEEVARPFSWAQDRLATDLVLGAHADRLVGTAGLAVPARRQERHQGRLFGMAVAPEAAGQGVGRRLVEEACAQAASLGLLQVALTVTEGNGPAERLYRACGFRSWGREERALLVDGVPHAKLHLVRHLDG